MYKMLAFVYANSAASEHSRLADKFADLRYFLYDLIRHGKRRGILFLLHTVHPTYILFYHASMWDAMHQTCMADLYVRHHISIAYLSNPFYTIIVVLGCSQLLPTENVVGIVMCSHLKVTAF